LENIKNLGLCFINTNLRPRALPAPGSFFEKKEPKKLYKRLRHKTLALPKPVSFFEKKETKKLYNGKLRFPKGEKIFLTKLL